MGWKNWNGKKLISQTNGAISNALYVTLEAVGEQADSQVPLDEGTLQRSKFIKVEGTNGVLSYGGGQGTGYPRVPYAVRWHENSANFQHGRKKRYLADPLNNRGPRIYKNALKQELGKAW